MSRIKNLDFDYLFPQSAKSLSHQSTLPSLSKIRTASLTVFNLNSSQSIPIQDSLLNQLKNRQKSSLEVTPLLVSKALHSYFIPMLEAQRKRRLNLKSMTERMPQKSLCEYLEQELKKSQEVLAKLNSGLSKSKFEKKVKLQEIDEVRVKLLNKSIELKCLGVRLKRKKATRKSRILEDQAKVFEYSNKKKNNITEKLHKESMLNNKIKDKGNKLKHWNSLIAMQSSTMGERLKGLYFACAHLSPSVLIDSLKEKTDAISNFHLHIDQHSQNDLKTLSQCLCIISQNIRQSGFILQNKKKIEFDLKKLKIRLKDSNEKYMVDIQKADEEKSCIEYNFRNLNQKIGEFENEYERMLMKMSKLKVLNKHFGDREEKVCKFCKVLFTEIENFNWSCRIHLSQWSGNQYWCCGSSIKDSVGCNTSKHVSNDEEEFIEEKGKVGKKNLNVKCRSCRKTGHEYADCLKDPNPRTLTQFERNFKKRRTISEVLDIFPFQEIEKTKLVEKEEADGFEEIMAMKKMVINFEFV